MNNYEHASLVVDLFVQHQIYIKQHGRNEQLIDMMDIIIKEVQGPYVGYFEAKMRFLFPQIWQMSMAYLQKANQRLS